MKVAIVGSRGFSDYEMLKSEISQKIDISRISEVISGGAIGADYLAEKFAHEFNIKMTVFRPNWSLGKGAGILRNKTIVETADVVFAFWDGESKGTKSSILLGDSLGKKVFVLTVKLNKEILELKQLSVYLPYEILIKVVQQRQIGRMTYENYETEHILTGNFLTWSLKNITPILRPLSDLDKEIEFNGEKIIPLHKIGLYITAAHLIDELLMGMIPVIVFDMLLKMHFDVYDLIGRGLGKDINDLSL